MEYSCISVTPLAETVALLNLEATFVDGSQGVTQVVDSQQPDVAGELHPSLVSA